MAVISFSAGHITFFTKNKPRKIIRRNTDGEFAADQWKRADGKRLKVHISNAGTDASREQFTDEMIPARWPDGFTQQSIIPIAPNETEIECLASYEIKTFNPIERKVTWGRVRLKIEP